MKVTEGPEAWEEEVLHSFNGNGDGGADPIASLTFGADGDLYGTAESAESVSGNVFRLTPPHGDNLWGFAVLYGFAGPPDGARPLASLVFDSVGNLYSTTQVGGTGTTCQFGCGTVFEVPPQARF